MALPKVDRRLNVVLECPQDDGTTIFIHHTPIGRPIFESHARTIGRAFSTMYGENISGPIAARIALPMLLESAKEIDREDVIKNQLLPEIWRLTNALVPTERGYETVPFHEVMAKQMLDEDTVEEVKNAIVFFTLASWVHSRTELTSLIYPLLDSLGARTVRQDCTDFTNSLPISTLDASTGEKATASSIPI